MPKHTQAPDLADERQDGALLVQWSGSTACHLALHPIDYRVRYRRTGMNERQGQERDTILAGRAATEVPSPVVLSVAPHC